MDTIKHKLTHTELIALYEFFGDVNINQKNNDTIMYAAIQSQILTKIKTKMVEVKTGYKLQITLAEAVAMNKLIGNYVINENLWLNNFLVQLMVVNDKFISNYRTAPLRKELS